MTRPHALIPLAVALLLACTPATNADPADARHRFKLQAQLVQAFQNRDYEHALELAENLADQQPHAPVPRYNRAAALAMLGDTSAAEQALKAALDRNFVRLHDLARDPHLRPLRITETYRLAVNNWRTILDTAAHNAVARFKHEHADFRYTFDQDPHLRIKKISAYPHHERQLAWDEIDRVTAFARATFPQWFDHQPERPPPWIILALPTPDTFAKLTRHRRRVAGIYDHNNRHLITRDLGSSLRHELVHALHWRHMERSAQLHPIWIREGLATLVEDLEGPPDNPTFLPNWRTNIVKQRAERNALTPLAELARLDHQRFHNTYASTHYAESRAVMMYLHHRGLLADWYARYTDNHADDPTGIEALTATLAKPLQDIEDDLAAWVRELPNVSEPAEPFGGNLGVNLERGQGYGPLVKTFGGRRATQHQRNTTHRIRYNDAIAAINGKPTPTIEELFRVLGHHQPGEHVAVHIRRGDQRLITTIRLRSHDDTPQ